MGRVSTPVINNLIENSESHLLSQGYEFSELTVLTCWVARGLPEQSWTHGKYVLKMEKEGVGGRGGRKENKMITACVKGNEVRGWMPRENRTQRHT